MINGNRIRQARELCGYTQAHLAELVNVHQSTITYLETGRIQPGDELVARLAMATRFPIAFFRQDDPPDFPEGSLLFRARTTLPAGVRDQVREHGEIYFEMMERLAARLKVIPPRLPQFADERDDPKSAAQFTRNALGLSPRTPIPHLVRAAEKCGVFVLTVPVSHSKLDGFSVWAGANTRRPVVVLCDQVPGDRQRYTVAHELGHLALHRTLQGSWHSFNDEADEFAAELLMPTEALIQEIETPVTLSSLASLKSRWSVSLRSLVRRAHTLGKIKDRQYRYLIQQLNQEGWRMREPIDVPIERPRAARKMAELLYPTADGGVDYTKLAAFVNLSSARVREFLDLQADKPQTVSSAVDQEIEADNAQKMKIRQIRGG